MPDTPIDLTVSPIEKPADDVPPRVYSARVRVDVAESAKGAGPDRGAAESHEVDSTSAEPQSDANRVRGKSRSAGSVMQSLTLLATMLVMLGLARYSVPRIVEEIRYAWHRGEMRAEYETGEQGLRNVSLDSLSRAYEMVSSAVGPSVVHIDVHRRGDETNASLQRLLRGIEDGGTTGEDGSSNGSNSYSVSDQGSGVIVDESGYILTNRHVITDGQQIWVTLSDGRRQEATVVGTDRLTDLAVLKVDAENLLPIRWGDSGEIRVGSPVWAVGSPFGLDRTITFGILSGTHRIVHAGARYGASARYQDFMQSDVAVNPGNSGGPLVDARGRCIGINTAIVGDTYQGVSFSIPSNVSKQIYEQLRDAGRVTRGWLGVMLEEVPDALHVGADPRIRGALISGLPSSESPGAIAGLLPGDIVVSVDETAVIDVGHLMRIVGQTSAQTELELEIRRNAALRNIRVRLGNRPDVLVQ
ncbi:MAG: trypsin-like peptidase domain-containing protein [Planctomycetota bacterium]